MPLKKSVGNMYEWLQWTHASLGGECPHKCSYCFVDNPRFGRPARYKGELRLIEDELKIPFRKKGMDSLTIFIENCNDLFAEKVPAEFIARVLDHCKAWPANTYVFQTKNPSRYQEFFGRLPAGSILGTTIETNRIVPGISEAPAPYARYRAMLKVPCTLMRFVTIEPVLDFDVDELAGWIADIHPNFLNLGADSKNHGLPEPPVEKIHALVAKLHEHGIELREKHNLERLTKRAAVAADVQAR